MPNDFMARAIQLSIDNVKSARGGPFGAVVAKDGAIVGEGVNEVTASNDPTGHAEILAIRQACRRLKVFDLESCEIYSSCEPCPMCMAAIYWARISRIYYANTSEDAARIGFDDSRIYRELSLAPGQRQIPTVRIMRQEAAVAFRAWENKPDKIRY